MSLNISHCINFTQFCPLLYLNSSSDSSIKFLMNCTWNGDNAALLAVLAASWATWVVAMPTATSGKGSTLCFALSNIELWPGESKEKLKNNLLIFESLTILNLPRCTVLGFCKRWRALKASLQLYFYANLRCHCRLKPKTEILADWPLPSMWHAYSESWYSNYCIHQNNYPIKDDDEYNYHDSLQGWSHRGDRSVKILTQLKFRIRVPIEITSHTVGLM